MRLIWFSSKLLFCALRRCHHLRLLRQCQRIGKSDFASRTHSYKSKTKKMCFALCASRRDSSSYCMEYNAKLDASFLAEICVRVRLHVLSALLRLSFRYSRSLGPRHTLSFAADITYYYYYYYSKSLRALITHSSPAINYRRKIGWRYSLTLFL